MKNRDKFIFNNMFSRLAFTIAEVLIVLGIIGIIAEMTIPTLMKNTQDAEFKAGFKKSFSEIAQALSRYNHEISDSFMMSDGYIDPQFWTYFKTEKICTDAITQGCWHSEYYTLDGGVVKLSGRMDILIREGVILSNGALIGVRRTPTGTRGVSLSGNLAITGCGNSEYILLPDYDLAPNANKILYLIDVNGFKLPNRIGKDIYVAYSVDTLFLRAPQVAQTTSDHPYETCKCYGASCSYAALMGN